MPLRIAFDVGGVLSKHAILRTLFNNLAFLLDVKVYVISDMHPVEKIREMLNLNHLSTPHIYSADYKKHGERCKQVLCDDLGIDILIDDFIGYVAAGKHVRLLVMPDPEEPYYSDDWKTDGTEGDFGRRIQ